jgi:copper chaperone
MNETGEDMTKVFEVEGMTCGGCEQSVTRALTSIPGVDKVVASHETKRVEVEGSADPAQIATAITDAGYEVLSGPSSA